MACPFMVKEGKIREDPATDPSKDILSFVCFETECLPNSSSPLSCVCICECLRKCLVNDKVHVSLLLISYFSLIIAIAGTVCGRDGAR